MSSCIHNGLLWYNLVETERRAASLPGPAFWEKLLVSGPPSALLCEMPGLQSTQQHQDLPSAVRQITFRPQFRAG